MLTRADFIKSVLKSGMLLSVPVQFFVKGKRYNAVQIYSTYVAGFRYYKGLELVSDMSVDDAVDILHEAENQHDDKAMALYYNGEKIGYLPMNDNELYCYLFNAGVPIYCDIVKVNADAQPWRMCKVAVYLLYPEDYIQQRPPVLNIKKDCVVKLITPAFPVKKKSV